MKKIRLFPKTFLYTMMLMSVIILVSHMLLYVLMPGVYVNQKNKNLTSLSEQAVQEMEGKSLEEVLSSAKALSESYDANITINVEDITYIFSSIMSVNTTTDVEIPNEVTVNPIVESINEGIYFSNEINGISLNGGLNDDSLYDFENHGTIQGTSSTILRENMITLDDGVQTSIKFMMNLQSVEEASNVMFLILPYTIGISILLSLCAAFIFARALTKPIRSICTSTKDMEKLSKDAQCVVSSQDEIGELAQDINQLYASLQQTIHSLKMEIENVSKAEKMKVDFLRSASHELKTPLTSMSVILENMILNVGKYKDHDTYIKKCKEIVDHLSLMIKDILNTSSMDDLSNSSMKEELSFDIWLPQQCEPYVVLAKSKKVKMKLQLDESLVVHVNTALFEKVISNILANAVQYTSANHSIQVTLINRKLCIYNECTPIDDKHLPHLKEAFYRPDFSRTKQTGGNGLGLYFVDQILTILNLPYTFVPHENGMLFMIDLSEA